MQKQPAKRRKAKEPASTSVAVEQTPLLQRASKSTNSSSPLHLARKAERAQAKKVKKIKSKATAKKTTAPDITSSPSKKRGPRADITYTDKDTERIKQPGSPPPAIYRAGERKRRRQLGGSTTLPLEDTAKEHDQDERSHSSSDPVHGDGGPDRSIHSGGTISGEQLTQIFLERFKNRVIHDKKKLIRPIEACRTNPTTTKEGSVGRKAPHGKYNDIPRKTKRPSANPTVLVKAHKKRSIDRQASPPQSSFPLSSQL